MAREHLARTVEAVSESSAGESRPVRRADAAAGEIAHNVPATACSGATSAAGCRRTAADVCLRERRWAEAAEAIASLADDDPAAAMQHRLARNFAALQQHRSALYERLIASKGSGATCQPARSVNGAWTLLHAAPGRGPMVLSPGGEPGEALRQMLSGLEDDLKRGRCLTLCGLGEGRLLTHLAAEPPQLQLGQQQCVHVIEPHPEVLLAALMIHDWSGEQGPIADRRFQWWVGPEWSAEIHAALDRDPYLPYPERPVRLSIDGDEVDARLRQVLAVLIEGEKRLAARVEKRYASGFIPRFAESHRGRGPRVLLLTTRFSTVLQHSTRDLAAAFEQLGWSVRMPIEPSDWHRNSRRNLLRHLADFQPDLVVQIDHLRHEHRGLFPPELPFACWIQDDLPNLTKREAGEQIGPRDFVLTTTAAVYEHDFGYPARQCLYMPKCTRLPDLDSIPRVEAPDVVYVSNASATPEALIEQVERGHARQPIVAQLIRAVGEELVARYARGETIAAVGQVQRILESHVAQQGVRPTDDGSFSQRLASRLFASINNALYRQQALDWAASACERLGLGLGLYGEGWERHPRFGALGRGPVRYGRDLESLTRSAKINLQIVPYMYLHQRWLDGVAAGGFFLIRAHPMDTLAGEIAVFIEANLGDSIDSLEAARRALCGEAREVLEPLIERRRAFDDHREADPIALYRAHRREGRGYIYEQPAHLREVRFGDAAALEALLAEFAGDELRRQPVAQAQRDFVERHFTYAAGLKRVLSAMAELIASEPTQPVAAPAPAGETSRCA